MSDQQDSPNHILNCNNCGAVTVIPKDAPFEYGDDFCQTCGKSYFEEPEPEEPEPEAMSDQDESPILFFECPHCEAANAIPRDAEYNEKYDNCGTCGQPIFEAPEEEEEEYDEKAMWASIREKLTPEEDRWLQSKVHDPAAELAIVQLDRQLQRHYAKQEGVEPRRLTIDFELEPADVQIIDGDDHAEFCTNLSVKQVIEARLLLAWVALKNADNLNDVAAPDIIQLQHPEDTAMDIIGHCSSEIAELWDAVIDGRIVIV